MSQWVRAWEWVLQHKDCPILIRSHVQKKAARILDKSARPASKPPIRFPKGKDPAKDKKRLHAECEVLCKALVFHRDCKDWKSREGFCITCCRWRELQWGHFIPRQEAPVLRYSVDATAGQCAFCNGFGQGEQIKFAQAIDVRDGVRTSAGLCEFGGWHKNWRWNKSALTQEREKLIAMCQMKRIPVEEVLKGVT